MGDRLVLTAEHCVQDAQHDEPTVVDDIFVTAGHDVFAPTESARVVGIATRAGRYEGGVDGLGANDLALLTLASAIGVPAPIGSETPAAGMRLTLVGYGQRAGGRFGERSAVAAEVIYPGVLLVTSPSACPGDSGAPLFDALGVIRGIATLRGGPCGLAGSIFIDAASARTWVAEAIPIRLAGTSSPLERCTGLWRARGCADDGRACTSNYSACPQDEQCVEGTCVVGPASAISRSCADGCSFGTACVGGSCVRGAMRPGDACLPGRQCLDGMQCLAGRCAAPCAHVDPTTRIATEEPRWCVEANSGECGPTHACAIGEQCRRVGRWATCRRLGPRELGGSDVSVLAAVVWALTRYRRQR